MFSYNTLVLRKDYCVKSSRLHDRCSGTETFSDQELHRFGLHPREKGRLNDAKDLEIKVVDYTLVSPLGISNGLNNNGEISTQLLTFG